MWKAIKITMGITALIIDVIMLATGEDPYLWGILFVTCVGGLLVNISE